jgi:hypothetical protein
VNLTRRIVIATLSLGGIGFALVGASPSHAADKPAAAAAAKKPLRVAYSD